MKLYLFIFSMIFISSVYSQTDSLFTDLPDAIYISANSRYSIYYDNVILSLNPQDFTFSVECSKGYNKGNSYNLDSLESGEYSLRLSVSDSLGNLTGSDSTKIFVTEKSIACADTLRLLFVGDSYTYVGVYQKYIKDLYLNSTGRPVKFLGTNYNPLFPFYGVDNGIYHEGYSRQTWSWFSDNSESPFAFDGNPEIDVERYHYESLKGESPDLIVMFLGINDVIHADASSIETIDEWIESEILSSSKAVKLTNAMLEEFPSAETGIVMIPRLNSREYTYTDPLLPDFWERKKLHHRLCTKYSEFCRNYGNGRISAIPVSANIDTYLGFGETDPLHPVSYGYMQIAHSIYGWIKYRISQMMEEPQNLKIIAGSSKIDLSWEETSGAYRYRIYRSENPLSGFSQIGTSFNPYFSDLNILQSNKYFYKVTSENFSGDK